MSSTTKTTQPYTGDEPRSEFVYKSLLADIRAGKLKPGDRIREEVVAASLGVSRTPVREALQHLQTRGLVEIATGRGTIVVDVSMHEAIEMYAMREVLEGAAARFAAQHALPAEISIMQDLLEEFVAAKGDPKQLAYVNHRLHRTIYRAARNKYMHEALNHLDDSLSLLQGTTFELEERFEPADREHREIVAAIANRDADAAEAASRRHIREAQSARMRILSSR